MTCEIDNDWGEYPECFKIIDRKARKEHQCCECLRTIKKNEIYRYESGIWNGEPHDYKTCNDCLSVRNAFFCNHQYGLMWKDVENMIIEYNGQISEKKVDSLTLTAKENILCLIDKLVIEK